MPFMAIVVVVAATSHNPSIRGPTGELGTVRQLQFAQHRAHMGLHGLDGAWNVINENRDILDELVRQLLVKETLNEKELAAIFANIKKAPKREVWLSDEKRPDSDIPPVPIPDKLKKSAGLTN